MIITIPLVSGKGLASLQAFVRSCFIKIANYYYYYINIYYYYYLCHCSLARAMASSSSRFPDHIQRGATVNRTPLDE
jgi:hypothetical protein